jgi:hypothetical protein
VYIQKKKEKEEEEELERRNKLDMHVTVGRSNIPESKCPFYRRG